MMTFNMFGLVRTRDYVLRLVDRSLVSDNSAGSWMVSLCGDRVWLGRLGDGWRETYGDHFALGLGRYTWWWRPRDVATR